jgi:hypothetical protein
MTKSRNGFEIIRCLKRRRLHWSRRSTKPTTARCPMSCRPRFGRCRVFRRRPARCSESTDEARKQVETASRRAQECGSGRPVTVALGSKIGHGPYQKLDATARNLLGRPEVQQRLDQVASAAPGPLGDAASKVTERLSASSKGSDATTETVLEIQNRKLAS